ncbi:NADH-quinone oxidoreductase subunit NuoN [Natronoglycomyces albus]|uniref:NADH-quinone oxidoreductase subunit N n=1 Tax=Natronoglycomyces albus TaxID=2811108 RepID=A0A895XTJ9_9ACTN|nr:NADH-quinone oxidoreductase subunit NuoN [Natronoglycomyces albus]QSB05856.1 NADH-quinone oxidoreductase subunit NuoN [Natronoglycomyces albus]
MNSENTLLSAEFIAPGIEWAALSPLIIVFGAAFLGLLFEATLPRHLRYVAQVPLAVLALLGALVAVLVNAGTSTAAFTRDGESLGSIIIDGPGLFLMGTIVVLGAVAILLLAETRAGGTSDFVAEAAVVADSPADFEQRNEPAATEIFPLALFAIAGMMMFVVAGDLLTMFVALEVMSLPLYLLCGLARRRRLLSQEAAMKYFLLGAFASAFFVYGMAMVYGFAGTVTFWGISEAAVGSTAPRVLLLAGIGLLSVGLLFKAAAVPFHMWTPDVYTGAPTPVTAMMAACVKVAAFGGLLRVFNMAFDTTAWDWKPLLTGIAVLTMLGGALFAVTQANIKRLLAYSSIANAGFLLIGVIALDGAIGATMFYLLAYGFTVLAAFGLVSLVRDRDGETTHLSRWAGLGKHSPLAAGVFTFLMLALAGIPLTSGFTAKFGLFSAGVTAGEWGLVLVAIAASAILAFPYLRVVVLVWLNEPADDAPTVNLPSPMTGTVVGVGAAATLLLGLVPGPLLNVISDAGSFLAGGG